MKKIKLFFIDFLKFFVIAILLWIPFGAAIYFIAPFGFLNLVYAGVVISVFISAVFVFIDEYFDPC